MAAVVGGVGYAVVYFVRVSLQLMSKHKILMFVVCVQIAKTNAHALLLMVNQ